MMHLSNPPWIRSLLLGATTTDQIPQEIFDRINEGLSRLQTGNAIASVVIPALNEELNIIQALYSLSLNKTTYPVEIIVVNNNSTDRTQEILERLNVTSYMQTKPGWGPARQLGQEKAKGKFILMADADCFYPPLWIQKMIEALSKDNVVCVYGKYSFIGTEYKPRWKLFLYECTRDLIASVRDIRRPWLNAVGMCMGYVKEFGLKIGFIDRKIPGEDGRMCFELMQFGKIRRLRSNDVTVWTLPRTLDKFGRLRYALINRAILEMVRFKYYFYKQAWHDTHTSQNFNPEIPAYLRKYLKRAVKDVSKKEELDKVK